MAILYALTNLCSANEAVVIFTDSASVLQALESGQSHHPWIQAIEEVTANKAVTYCWIPGHVGIAGNEKADALAKAEASMDENDDESLDEVPRDDVIRSCKTEIRKHWEHKWRNSTSFLRSIKSTTLQWPDRHSATERRAISRLRIGHTRLTHQHLFNRDRNTCETCGEPVTVPHLLLDCRAYDTQRRECNLSSTIGDILCPIESEEKKLVKFLNDTKLLTLL